MRGYLRRRSPGSWELTIDLGRDPASGLRRRRFLAVKGGRKDAEKKLTELLHNLNAGTYVDPTGETVATYLERWLVEHVRLRTQPRTYGFYSNVVSRYLIPAFGHMKLTELRARHISEAESRWLGPGANSRTQDGLAPQTVLHHHRVLHAALRQAVRWGVIGLNPADAVQPPRVTAREAHVLDAAGAASLMDTALQGNAIEEVHATAIVTMLFTGVRPGELLALRWADLDLDRAQLYVRRTIHKEPGGGVRYGPAKTHRSNRALDMPADLVALLRARRAAQARQRLLAGDVWEDADLVFADGIGKPIGNDVLLNRFHRLREKAGLPPMRLYDLRHTMATLMLSQGEYLRIVQERLGHSSPALTLRTYAGILPGQATAAAERLADTLRNARHSR